MAKNYTFVPGAEFPWQYRYEHMAVTTDCVIFTHEDWKLKVLLVRRGGEPYKGQWAFPGGFLRIDETAEEGALRELREETGFTPSAIHQLGVFSDVDRDPRERVITIAWYALVKPGSVIAGDDADEAAWFPVNELPPLAFDHEKIFREAMERLKRDIHFEPVGFSLLGDEFTIPDLQRIYEQILGTSFDRRNFQRKILSSGILEEAPFMQEPRKQEPCMRESSMREPCMPMMAAPMPRKEAEPAPEPQKKARRGRTGILFRLNRERYQKLKDEEGKQEF